MAFCHKHRQTQRKIEVLRQRSEVLTAEEQRLLKTARTTSHCVGEESRFQMSPSVSDVGV